jgi:hypothetical protein
MKISPIFDPGMISLSAHASHDGGACAKDMSGKIEPKKISAAMADNLLIKHGQLNRMNRNCQADLRCI